MDIYTYFHLCLHFDTILKRVDAFRACNSKTPRKNHVVQMGYTFKIITIVKIARQRSWAVKRLKSHSGKGETSTYEEKGECGGQNG